MRAVIETPTFVRPGDMFDWTDWPDHDRAVVVTDPPFGVGKTYAGRQEVRDFGDYLDAVLAIPAIKHVVRAPQRALLDLRHRPDAILIECVTYGPAKPGRRLQRWAPWLIFGRPVVVPAAKAQADWFTVGPSYAGRRDVVARMDTARGDTGDHPGLTPADAVAAVLTRTCEPGTLVVDPFAGMGGIGTVALVHGLAYWGLEIVPEWASIAEQRCAAASAARRVPLWSDEKRSAPTALLGLDE